jgi:exodeoxyribonuclease VII small subunit
MGDDTELKFEEALTQLERIVASLERGEPELSTALSKYEKGVQLLSICHRLLEKAEQSVAILTGVDAEGNALTTHFDATATLAREAGSSAASSTAATPAPAASEPKSRGAERPSVRRGRSTPVDDATDAGDPPF